MSTAGLEINDAGVALAVDDVVVCESPGYALGNGEGLWVGEQARERARLAPREVNHAFWERLDIEELARPVGYARTHADLAAAHLDHVWSRRGESVDSLIVAVPGSFSRAQLGLLLGVAEQLALPVRGLVDSALASVASHDDGAGPVVHVEARLHGALVTVVERGSGLRVISRAPVEGFGLLGVADALARAVAVRFVRDTRFDPRRSAASEQALYAGLLERLARLRDEPAARIELASASGARHAVEVEADEVEAAIEPWLRPLAEQLRALVPAGATVRVGHHLAALPFAVEYLSRAAGAAVKTLPRGAAALGAASRAEAIVLGGGPRSLASSIGAPRAPAPAALAGGPPPRPTHVVHAGLAHAIAGGGFTVGGTPGADAVLAIPGCAEPVHCVLRDGEGVVTIDPLEPVLLNGRPLERTAPLAAGDRVAFPGCDAELLLIALSDGPQA